MPNRNDRRPGWRGFLPRPFQQVGRRGAILLIFGGLWVVLGVSVLDEPESSLLHEVLSPQIRSTMWVSTGLVAALHAFRPPGISDAIGFAALYVMPALRVLSYSLAWGASVMPGLGPGDPDAWRLLAVYSAILGAVVVMSGWAEEAPIPIPIPEKVEGTDE